MENWNSCLICGARSDSGVGVQVCGEREGSLYWTFIATVASCPRHRNAAARQTVLERWGDGGDELFVRTVPRVANEVREQWLREAILRTFSGEGDLRVRLESAWSKESERIWAFEGFGFMGR